MLLVYEGHKSEGLWINGGVFSMRSLKSLLVVLVVILAVSAVPARLLAQAGASGSVVGTVSDPTGAVVPGAKVELRDTATNQVRTQESGATGLYRFNNVKPGVYRLTVTMQGFRTGVISDLKVEVTRTYNVNVTLEIGDLAQVVEVTAGATVELQTADATIGDVIGGEELQRLPTLNRSAASLLLLQPLVVGGGRSVANYEGGQVAGSRSDQHTFLIDGGDATNDTEAGGHYAFGTFDGFPQPAVPVPVESIEEFRVSTTNPSADFGRSAGGAITLSTKRGTNALHGSVYWYHQNDNLNANAWDLNRVGVDKAELKDNRFGFSLGGPIFKDKTFIYGHYEGRRFPRSTTITRLVPTAAMRQGILTYTDAGGTDVAYNLATSTLCGPTNSVACDPRAAALGFSLSPVMQAYFALYPAGNDSSLGDGLNTIGFRGTANNTLETDFVVGRFDHQISNSWSFLGSYRYSDRASPDTRQIDIAGLLPGNTSGQPAPAAASPVSPRFWVAGVDGQITSRLTSQTRISWTRNWWEWVRTSPFPQVSGTAGAIDVGGDATLGELSEPLNINTQQARSRVWNGKDWYISENLSYATGTHTIQFGGNYRRHDIFHRRNDKVTGAVDSLIYFLQDGAGVTIPDANRPPTCGGAIVTNCLASGDVGSWNDLYTAITGMIDQATILQTRDLNFDPLPLGLPMTANVDLHSYEVFAQDTWRVTPTFTFTYGLSYQLQMPPYEPDSKQVMTVFRATGRPVYLDDYLNSVQEAALAGNIYNPELAWSPTRRTGRKYTFDPDYNNFGPRIAAAWNPSFADGFMGSLFGDRKTVLRGGYGLVFDRINGVGSVMTPLLGVGFGQILVCQGPTSAGVCSGGSVTPSTGFRLGPDGSSVPMPTPAPGQIPFPVSSPWGEISARGHDPGRTMGENHSINFTIQRELPGNMILEVGYVGKFSRQLLSNVSLNTVPFFHTDPASGQTLAQAFDVVAIELRNGVAASAITPQAWFENQLVAANIAAVVAGGSCDGLSSNTAAVACLYSGDFQDNWLGGLFIFDIDFDELGPNPFGFVNVQSRTNQMVTDGSISDYHAGFLSLRKRMSHGLTFGLNYTYSKALDEGGLNQEYVNSALTAFDRDIGRGPAFFDRTHSLNLHWFYELPVGRSGTAADKIIGGWSVAGIFTAMSALPLCVWDGGDFGDWFTATGTCAIATSSVPDSAVNSGVAGSGGVGTSGTSGQNMFADPEAVFNSFRPILFSQDRRNGQGMLRGLPRWDLSLSLGKETMVTERVSIGFGIDFVNIFNHVELNDPSTFLVSPASFGVLSSQYNSPRQIQFGLRVEF
jgi:hypothetical protein